ncbi:hypothetical protein [Achromobacter xylosoxidans]|uniref:hypothetical protein n=1 Tax=Alcaligenes xylosoxydans xylosoxydans TaxID=85698 RepID=UPI0038FD3DA3
MATNELLPFAIGPTANVLTQAEYLADSQRDSGNVPGVARSKLANKAQRQSSFVASMVGLFIAEQSGIDVLDDGDIPGLKADFLAALNASQSCTGQCRLSVASATSLVLKPYNGSSLIIGGVRRSIPSGGVNVTNAGVPANSLRYVYAFMSGSSMALEVVATGHSTGTDGIEIKTGDPSRSLVGMVYTNASSQFVDSVTQRHCLNWFNRRSLNCYIFSGSSFNFTTSVGAEISTTLRASFLSWPDEATAASITGYASVSTGNIANIQVSVDGSNSLVGGSFSIFPPSGGGQGGYSSVANLTLSEGLHTSQIWGAVAGGATGTIQNTVNTVVVRG